MILDSEAQKKLLQDIVESTTFSAKPNELAQVSVNVQALRMALNNAEIAESAELQVVGD